MADFLTTLLILTALCLSLPIILQTLSSYRAAYLSAPTDITTFIDCADFSVQENESYDRDIAKVQRLEDKMRLGRLLREIQRCGDDLREELNRSLVDEVSGGAGDGVAGDGGVSGTRLRTSARLFWKSRKAALEEKVRRGDLLRMRFLVVYLGLVAHNTSGPFPPPPPPTPSTPISRGDSEKSTAFPYSRPVLGHALTDGITRKPPPLRRLTTQAMGHNEATSGGQKMGWLGVVAELQRSPLMHKRHASIENAMNSSP